MAPRKLSLGLAAGASLLGLILLLAGAFRAADLALQSWLHFPAPPPSTAIGWQMLWIVILGICATVIAMDWAEMRTRVLLVAAIFLQPLSALAIAALGQRFFSPFAALTTIGLASAGAAVYHRSQAGHAAQNLRRLFGDRLAEASLHSLFGRELPLWPEETPATVLAASPAAPDAASLAKAAEFCKNRGAWVEIHGGTRLLAIFNTPILDLQHARTAALAALDFFAKNAEWQTGIASGTLRSGISASGETFQVAGTLLDEAENLIRAGTDFGAAILLNLAAYDGSAQDVLLRPLGFLPGGGPEVFEPLAPLASAAPEMLHQRDHFWQGLILQRENRLAEAAAAFRQAGDDAVTQKLLHRLEEQRNRGQN